MVALAAELLDAVLVHSDPRFARLEDTFGASLRVPVHYTGFVTGPVPAPARREPVIVVSAGGGRVGEPLLRAAIEAAPDDVRLRVITGPLFPRTPASRAASTSRSSAASPTSPPSCAAPPPA